VFCCQKKKYILLLYHSSMVVFGGVRDILGRISLPNPTRGAGDAIYEYHFLSVACCYISI